MENKERKYSAIKLFTETEENFDNLFCRNLEDHVEQFYFHSDHLGSSNYITNYDGNITQHSEYLPFGELLVDEHRNSHNTRYKFNGKEFDQETGNYYYGARYYDPKTSLWLSVDPLAEKYNECSPYNYTLNNPVKYVDPDGSSVDEAGKNCCPEPPDDYHGGSLEEVTITIKNTWDDTWTSETSLSAYSNTRLAWEKEHGMKAWEYTNEDEIDYDQAYSNSVKRERLARFISRLKMITYDTGGLHYSASLLKLAAAGKLLSVSGASGLFSRAGTDAGLQYLITGDADMISAGASGIGSKYGIVTRLAGSSFDYSLKEGSQDVFGFSASRKSVFDAATDFGTSFGPSLSRKISSSGNLLGSGGVKIIGDSAGIFAGDMIKKSR